MSTSPFVISLLLVIALIVSFVAGDDVDREKSDSKRSGFMPMRGRREPFQQPLDAIDEDKRARGFIPSRGRKSWLVESIPEEEKKSGFVPMRGKKEPGFGDYYGEQLDGLKRAGFMPMRGRKWSPAEDMDYESPDKRAGFVPMRGKKYPYWVEGEGMTEEEKRGRQFFGMRGKREAVQHQGESSRGSHHEDPFYALRGKRSL